MIEVYTDGSSRGNPGPGGWGVVFIGEKNVAEFGGREKHTTNNRMELTATIEALVFANNKNIEKLTIKTDSQYVINGITNWVIGWQKKNWIGSNKKPVLNRDLWERLIETSSTIDIKWEYVKGHSGDKGNDRADEIATTYADDKPTKLYTGGKINYKL